MRSGRKKRCSLIRWCALCRRARARLRRWRASYPPCRMRRVRSCSIGLTTIADFRYFKDPPATAQAVARLVSVHDDRLTPDERTAYNRLYDTFSRGGDPEAFLRAAETLLGGYPAVKTLLDGAKTFVRPVPFIEASVRLQGSRKVPPPPVVAAVCPSRGGLMSTLLGHPGHFDWGSTTAREAADSRRRRWWWRPDALRQRHLSGNRARHAAGRAAYRPCGPGALAAIGDHGR